MKFYGLNHRSNSRTVFQSAFAHQRFDGSDIGLNRAGQRELKGGDFHAQILKLHAETRGDADRD